MSVTDLAIGFVLITVGAASLLLSALYWRGGGPTLLSFGLFGLLYGGRVLLAINELATLLRISPLSLSYLVEAVTYTLPLPLMVFTEQILGAGWRSLLRRLWQTWAVAVVIFIGYDLARGPGAASDVWYVALVVMLFAFAAVLLITMRTGSERRAGGRILAVSLAVFTLFGVHDLLDNFGLLPWTFPLERYGLTVFVLSLGYITSRRVFRNQQDLATMEYELRTAAGIQASILPRSVPEVRGISMAVRHIPMRAVAGDIYDFADTNDGRVGVLLADVSGHGVPAALIASMAKVAFSAQAHHAARPGQVLDGMNQALCGHHLDGQFVTAVYVYVDAPRNVIHYGGAGHPPPLLYQAGSGDIVQLDEGSVFLGFDPGATYRTAEMSVQPGDRLLLYTDGVTEATNAAGDFVGGDGLRQLLRKHSNLSANDFADAIRDRLREWTGRGRGDHAFEDDVTFAVIDIRSSVEPASGLEPLTC